MDVDRITVLKEDEINVNSDISILCSDMHFLSCDALYVTEKPYRFHFSPGPGFPRTNLLLESRPIDVHDMRPILASLSLDIQGFEIYSMETKMAYNDFGDMDKVNDVYAKEIKDLLYTHLGAKHVHLLDFQVRRRHPEFPISTGERYKHAQPNLLAHIGEAVVDWRCRASDLGLLADKTDVTLSSIKDIIQESFGDAAEQICASRFQCITIWRPLKGPVRDWPLAVCDARTVEDRDIVPADAIYPTYVAENCMIHFSKTQKWYYLSDQTSSELLVFKAVDSEEQYARPCPHAACPMGKSEAYVARESVDVRALVFYADMEYPAGKDWVVPERE